MVGMCSIVDMCGWSVLNNGYVVFGECSIVDMCGWNVLNSGHVWLECAQ